MRTVRVGYIDKYTAQHSVQWTLGILARFQAVFYASAFFRLDGVPPSTPAPLTQAVRRFGHPYENNSHLYSFRRQAACLFAAVEEIRVWREAQSSHDELYIIIERLHTNEILYRLLS